MMSSKFALGGGLAMLFAVTVLILTRLIPSPHRPADYLVMGALATLFCLAVVAAVFFMTRKDGDTFFKQRRK